MSRIVNNPTSVVTTAKQLIHNVVKLNNST